MSISSISSANADALFSVLGDTQTQMASLAQTALSTGADRFTKGDYAGAISNFKRAVALDPSNSAQAYDLLATTYVQQKNNPEAIKAYKASIAMNPSDDNAHLKLGNIYFSQGQYSDSEKEYKLALQLNPTSSTNLFSVGQASLALGKYSDAESVFQQLIKRDPSQYANYYALGQTYAKEGRQPDAITQFQKVISLKKDFYQVRVDLGSAYADLGQMDKAQEQLNVLNQSASNLSPLLSGYIDKVTKPKILAAVNVSGFDTSLGPGTPLSYLSPSLVAPWSSHLFNEKFVFDKNMDASSVHNVANWTISKTGSGDAGGPYNWGVSKPTDVPLSPVPLAVAYDPDTLTATVSFLLWQNAAGNGTIDPSHVSFKFTGKDTFGNAMDPSADQFSGISKIV